jgi:hypothetical protein
VSWRSRGPSSGDLILEVGVGGLRPEARTFGLADWRTGGLTGFTVDARPAFRDRRPICVTAEIGVAARSRTASANSGAINTVEISLARAVRGTGHDPNFFVSKSVCGVSNGAGERGCGGRVCR